MITLPFRTLPGVTDLFADYCSGDNDAKNYFLGHFTDVMAYETHFQLLARRSYFREELYRALHDQNRRFGAGEKTLERLRSITDPRTLCVLTGQQVGLFTGPLYTLYKALTARHLSQWLGEQFPAYTFLPVFWLESEDHDLDEAGTASIIDRNNDLLQLRYAEPDPDGTRNVQPVGSMALDARIDEVLARVEAALQPSDFTADTIATLREAYAAGRSFTEAFASYFNNLYPDSGIVFADPSDPELKKLLAPVVLQELETFPVSGEEVIKRSAELEEHYHAQVKPRAVNLFYLHKGGRYPIEPGEDGFFLRGSRQRFSTEELLEIANVQPERFSPNVLLRPIFQDYLFPTAAYVAGPAEVAYFAQLQPVYDHFQIPMPVIVPRASITLIEQKITKLFNKFGLQYASMFDSPEELYRDMQAAREGEEGLSDFSLLKNGVLSQLARLPDIAAAVQPQLADPAKNTVQNIEKYLVVFEEKLFQSRREKDTTIQRQLDKLHVYVSPDGKPQERYYTIATYLNRYGRGVLDLIDAQCRPFPAEHRLLFM